jgi:hypothetical protein
MHLRKSLLQKKALVLGIKQTTLANKEMFVHLLCLVSVAQRSDVRLDLFGYRLWKIPDCCNHFAMACMTIQLRSHISNRTKRMKVD